MTDLKHRMCNREIMTNLARQFREFPTHFSIKWQKSKQMKHILYYLQIETEYHPDNNNFTGPRVLKIPECINPFLVQLMHFYSLLKQIKIGNAAPTCFGLQCLAAYYAAKH